MMDKRKAAEIILEAINYSGPVNVNWNNKEWWIKTIMIGLARATKKETPGAATPRESR